MHANTNLIEHILAAKNWIAEHNVHCKTW